VQKQRWEEEVLLVQEEMRCVVRFYEWKAEWWQVQSQCCSDLDIEQSIIHGVTTYAEKQAHLCECLARSCVTLWWPVLNGDAPSYWEDCYPDISNDRTVVIRPI
jgi:hypothetical protein